MVPFRVSLWGGLASGETGGFSPPGNDFWPLVGALLGFAALLALSYFGLKFLSRRNLMGARGSHMRVLDRMAIGKDSTILIVELAGRVLAVGVTREGFSTLCELNPEEWSAGDAAPRAPVRTRAKGPAAETAGLWKRFVHNLGVNSGVLPKDTPPARPDGDEPTITFGEYLAKTQAEAHIQADDRPVSGQAASGGPGHSSIRREEAPAPPRPASGGFAYRNEAPLQQTYMNPTPYDAVLHDARRHYTEALANVKRYSNMEKPDAPDAAPPPKAWAAPVPAPDPAAALHAAHAHAGHQDQHPPQAPAPGEPPAVDRQMEDLAGRVSQRADRLGRKAKREGGKKAE